MKEKNKKIKRINRKLGIAFDSVKAIVIILVLLVLIVFFGSAIIHNLLRVGEVSSRYKGEYKKLYSVDDKMMNLYIEGKSDIPLVILPSFGLPSPVIQYKALANSLSKSFKVIIAEPLGYGYSLSTDKERTTKNIVEELRKGLQSAEIEGPYILMTFSNSSIYANYYSKNYPEEIMGIISVDPMYAEALDNDEFSDKYIPNLISNVKFYSAISFSGFFRWKSYLDPESFKIDKIQKNDIYGKDEIKIYRNRIANKLLTKDMKNEIYKLKENMKELKDFSYDENLTTLQIITEDYKKECESRGENVEKYAENIVTNKELQTVSIIDGNLEDYLFNNEMIKQLKMLINVYF